MLEATGASFGLLHRADHRLDARRPLGWRGPLPLIGLIMRIRLSSNDGVSRWWSLDNPFPNGDDEKPMRWK